MTDIPLAQVDAMWKKVLKPEYTSEFSFNCWFFFFLPFSKAEHINVKDDSVGH